MSNISNDGSSNTAVVALIVIFVIVLLGVYFFYPFQDRTVERERVIESETVIPGNGAGNGGSYLDSDAGGRSGTNGRGTTNRR